MTEKAAKTKLMLSEPVYGETTRQHWEWLTKILEARRVELIAFGEAKADIVRRAMKETPSAGCPATWLQQHPRCTFHLDAAAAKAL